jgi:hypothetical protein
MEQMSYATQGKVEQSSPKPAAVFGQAAVPEALQAQNPKLRSQQRNHYELFRNHLESIY